MRIVLYGSVYAILLFIYTCFAIRGTVGGVISQWDSLVYMVLTVVPGAFALYYILCLVRKRLFSESISGIPLIYRIVICLILIPGIFGTGTLIYKSIFLQGISLSEFAETWSDLLPRGIAVSIFTGIVYPVIGHSLDTYGGLQRMQVEATKIRTEQMNLRNESLRNQISPHFIFNSLNTISSLIYRNPGKADAFIRHLASLYQSVMDHFECPVISLKDELMVVTDYGSLMQTRFENAFSMEIDVDDDAGSMKIPPMSVQMLVENAVKHNRLSTEHPLRISIFNEQETLVVRNNIIVTPGHASAGGMGLENIQKRYRFLTNRKMVIRKDEHFTVILPLLEAHDE